MTIRVNLNTKDKKILTTYAKQNNLSLSAFLRKVALERIEDLEDLETAESSLKEMQQTNEKPEPLETLWAELGL